MHRPWRWLAFLSILSLNWAFAGGCSILSAAEPKDEIVGKRRPPNILLIYADDQNYKTVGCNPGSFPWVKTPHIDRLAATGIRFNHCYLGSWCMKSVRL